MLLQCSTVAHLCPASTHLLQAWLQFHDSNSLSSPPAPPNKVGNIKKVEEQRAGTRERVRALCSVSTDRTYLHSCCCCSCHCSEHQCLHHKTGPRWEGTHPLLVSSHTAGWSPTCPEKHVAISQPFMPSFPSFCIFLFPTLPHQLSHLCLYQFWVQAPFTFTVTHS